MTGKPTRDLLPPLQRLHEAFGDADVVYVAACCGRVSMARTPQTRCATCTASPRALPVHSPEELRRVAAELTVPEPISAT